jgi:2-dehydropantoate 2-reductase
MRLVVRLPGLRPDQAGSDAIPAADTHYLSVRPLCPYSRLDYTNAVSPVANEEGVKIMAEAERVYILGAGAIGLALAAQLVHNGKEAVAVRTSSSDASEKVIEVEVRGRDDSVIKAPVEMISLAKLEHLHGVIVVTAKSYANTLISAQLREKGVEAPIVIMQNGIGVEEPYIQSGFSEIYRCIVYATSQKTGQFGVSFRAVAASPIGIIKGSENSLERYVQLLSTPAFEFDAEPNIQEEIWKKAILNSVFNSICPLLDVDNGVFVRDEQAAELAAEIVEECTQVARGLGLNLDQGKLMEQIQTISRGSEGQFISTLQDIRSGKQTEIETLNLEIARVAEKLSPEIDVSKTKLLGSLILSKSLLHRKPQ